MINEKINELMIATKGKQMTREEYQEISSQLGNKNFLVFGTGYDSDLWRLVNRNGKTIFLENLEEWIPKNSEDVVKVDYNTVREDYQGLLLEQEKLEMKCLPESIANEKWDIIFVDSPTGYSKKCPGRMQSIYTASKLANKDTLVYIHDCNRKVEDTYSKHFFEIDKQFTKLRRCKIK